MKKKVKAIIDVISEFFYGVKKEMLKIRWTSKKSLIKYSIAVCVFIFILSMFFIFSDLIIALFTYLKELL